MKHLLSFLAGVIVGVIGVFVYQVFGKPVEPTRPATPMEGLAHFIGGLSRSLDDTQPIYIGNPTITCE